MQFCAQILRTELRNYSVDSLLARVRTYSKVVYHEHYKSQFTEKTKGQKLIFKSLGIGTDEPEPDEEDNTEKLLS